MLYINYKECEALYHKLDKELEESEEYNRSITEILLLNKLAAYLNSIDDACCRCRITEK